MLRIYGSANSRAVGVLIVDLKQWPHMHAWFSGCGERPAAKQARAMRET